MCEPGLRDAHSPGSGLEWKGVRLGELAFQSVYSGMLRSAHPLWNGSEVPMPDPL